MKAPDALLTPDELAARWQVPRSHVYRLTRDGLLPAVRLGRYYRYRLEGIEQFERDGGAGNGTAIRA
jgi:excisionase family DNA binding protein